MKFEFHNHTAEMRNQVFCSLKYEANGQVLIGQGAGAVHVTTIGGDKQRPAFHATVRDVQDIDVVGSDYPPNAVTVRFTTEGGTALWLAVPVDSVDHLIEVLREGERRHFQKQAEQQMESLETSSAN